MQQQQQYINIKLEQEQQVPMMKMSEFNKRQMELFRQNLDVFRKKKLNVFFSQSLEQIQKFIMSKEAIVNIILEEYNEDPQSFQSSSSCVSIEKQQFEQYLPDSSQQQQYGNKNINNIANKNNNFRSQVEIQSNNKQDYTNSLNQSHSFLVASNQLLSSKEQIDEEQVVENCIQQIQQQKQQQLGQQKQKQQQQETIDFDGLLQYQQSHSLQSIEQVRQQLNIEEDDQNQQLQYEQENNNQQNSQIKEQEYEQEQEQINEKKEEFSPKTNGIQNQQVQEQDQQQLQQYQQLFKPKQNEEQNQQQLFEQDKGGDENVFESFSKIIQQKFKEYTQEKEKSKLQNIFDNNSISQEQQQYEEKEEEEEKQDKQSIKDHKSLQQKQLQGKNIKKQQEQQQKQKSEEESTTASSQNDQYQYQQQQIEENIQNRVCSMKDFRELSAQFKDNKDHLMILEEKYEQQMQQFRIFFPDFQSRQAVKIRSQSQSQYIYLFVQRKYYFQNIEDMLQQPQDIKDNNIIIIPLLSMILIQYAGNSRKNRIQYVVQKLKGVQFYSTSPRNLYWLKFQENCPYYVFKSDCLHSMKVKKIQSPEPALKKLPNVNLTKQQQQQKKQLQENNAKQQLRKKNHEQQENLSQEYKLQQQYTPDKYKKPQQKHPKKGIDGEKDQNQQFQEGEQQLQKELEQEEEDLGDFKIQKKQKQSQQQQQQKQQLALKTNLCAKIMNTDQYSQVVFGEKVLSIQKFQIWEKYFNDNSNSMKLEASFDKQKQTIQFYFPQFFAMEVPKNSVLKKTNLFAIFVKKEHYFQYVKELLSNKDNLNEYNLVLIPMFCMIVVRGIANAHNGYDARFESSRIFKICKQVEYYCIKCKENKLLLDKWLQEKDNKFNVHVLTMDFTVFQQIDIVNSNNGNIQGNQQQMQEDKQDASIKVTSQINNSSY